MVTMVTNTRLSLRLEPEVIKELKEKALAEGKSISNFIIDSKNYFDFELIDGIALRVDYINPIRAGSEVYRIDVQFKESGSQRILRSLHYEIWVLQDIVEDALHTPQSPKAIDFAEFAFRLISKRFKKNGNVLPDEYGVFLLPNRTDKLTKSRGELWQWYDEATGSKGTGQKDTDGREVRVHDLVVLAIPGNRLLEETIVFSVFDSDGDYFIEKHSGPMSDGDPLYRQELKGQVFKAVGDIKSGVNEKLFKKVGI